jgi:hypothetical protein
MMGLNTMAAMNARAWREAEHKRIREAALAARTREEREAVKGFPFHCAEDGAHRRHWVETGALL